MATQQAKEIFVTGIVGRAMGSGKFTGADIQALTDLAAQAFENTFGAVAEQPAQAPQQPYSPAPGPKAMPSPALPEGKDFSIWKNDKCGHWDKDIRDTTWSWLLQRAKSGDDKAKTVLTGMANNDPGDPGDRWYAANLKRTSRAKAVLLMLG